MNKVFADLPVTIFEAMSQLARDNNAINLGQGFPDDPGPEDIRRAAADAVMNGYNQYPSMMGIPSCGRRSRPITCAGMALISIR
jgi:aspartate/methionine/tyrosine aminotransferase